MQIIHYKKFFVPVSTGTSKVDNLLSNSISEGVIFQNFLENTYTIFIYLIAHISNYCSPAQLSFSHLTLELQIPKGLRKSIVNDTIYLDEHFLD